MPSSASASASGSSVSLWKSVYSALLVTFQYWFTLIEYIFLKKPYKDTTFFKHGNSRPTINLNLSTSSSFSQSQEEKHCATNGNHVKGCLSSASSSSSLGSWSSLSSDTWSRVQIYSLSLIFYMWSKPHYRSRSFQQDMIDNLRNVAIPGTGLPLSIFCYNYWTALFFVFFLNPLICFFGALNKARKLNGSLIAKIKKCCHEYKEHLLHPQDWFSFWRLNCRLTSLHSLKTSTPGYIMEDKWTFLLEGDKMNVPVSPFLDVETLVCKNKNVEGGMGIYFFKNAVHGGDWILQEKLVNDSWLNELLPKVSPLSTVRVITSSTWALQNKDANPSITKAYSSYYNDKANEKHKKYISSLSCVLRLGRAGASTDHNCVLFDVDMKTGTILKGVSNMHWYQLGISKAFTCPWLPVENFDSHPDPPYAQVTGKQIPNIEEAIDIVTRAHFAMMPDVAMVGWDVAFTPKGIFLLEVNLSCNFFKGTFDIPKYISMVDNYWAWLDSYESEI